MAFKNFIDKFVDVKPAVARAVDKYVAREQKKEKRRLEQSRRKIRKIAQRIKDFDPWNL